MRFPSLRSLVEGLRARQHEARRELERLCGSLLNDLFTVVRNQFLPEIDPGRMVWRGLRFLDFHLTHMPEDELLRLEAKIRQEREETGSENDWGDIFRSFVAVTTYVNVLPGPMVVLEHAALLYPELADWFHATSRRETASPCVEHARFEVGDGVYETSSFQLPCEKESGDAVIAQVTDNALWVIVGDATGHGPIAHPAIAMMTHQWGEALRQLPRPLRPMQILEKLEDLLLPCLPKKSYVEAVLARFSTQEGVTLVGGGRVFFHRTNTGYSIVIQELEGHWLGMKRLIPDEIFRSQFDAPFCVGDEVTLASDGLYEHPYGDGEARLGRALPNAAHPIYPGRSLHDAFMELLSDIQWRYDRDDDLTLVTVRRVS